MLPTSCHRLVLFGVILTVATAAADAQELNWAQKMFEKQSHDFGVVARGAEVIYRLKLKNIYQQTVHIANVRTSCGCSAASPSTDTLQSLEEAYIQISMDTRRFTREKNSKVIITFDQPRYEEVVIPIHAYIRTDVVFTPGAAEFGAIAQGTPQERRIEVAYAGRADWTIRDVQTNNPHISATFVETQRSGGRVNYDLVVQLSPDAPAGLLREQILLITDDQNSPKVPLLVEAKIEPEITVTPDPVSLGVMRPNERKTVNVVLKGRKPFTVDKIESETGSEAFQVRLPERANIVHVLPLIVTAPAGEGDLVEEFTVTVSGIPQPVHFRVSGRVAGTGVPVP